MKAASQARRKPALEEIEPRILYAADFSPGVLAAAPSLLGVEHRTLDAGGEFATRQQSTHSTPQQQATRHEVVFVDTATPDYQKLVDDIKAQSGGDRRFDVVLLDPNVDGIKQISATLAGMKDVSAVHIIGHGADGQIDLGRDTLNFDSLLKNASQIKGWGQALTQDADVLIYGCDVAEHTDGKALVDALARLTGADVAASENLTGAADKGGDWTLEFSTGHLETALAVSAAEQHVYQSVLQGIAVGSEVRVNTTTAGTQTTAPNPQRAVATDTTGNYVVVWSGNGTQTGEVDADGIFAQRFNASGVAQGSEFLVNTNITNAQTQPSVAMDANGNFVIAWTTAAGGSGTGVHAQRFNAAGVAQGSEVLVNSFTTGDQNTPSVAMNASGFVIAWTSVAQDSGGHGVYAQRYDATGTTQGSEFRVNASQANDQDLDSVAMDASGNFLVTWASDGQDGNLNGVYSRLYNSAGTALTGDVRVNTTTSGDQFYSSSAMNASGDYVVTWTSMNQDGASGGIYGQRYNSAGVAQGGEFRVNTSTAGDQEYSNVSMDSSGNFVVAWSSKGQDSGTTWGIYKQEYNADGTVNGSEIKINTTIALDQLYSSVAMTPSRNFVAVWSGNGTGDGGGVFAQRYNAANDAPAGTDKTVTTLEDTVYTFAAVDFGFTDPNDSPANSLTAVKISTIPGAGTLALSGVAVTAGQTVSAANIAAGNLKFTPGANASGAGYASFTFQVQDDGGTASGGVDLDQSPNTMTVNVTAVNDAPAGTNKTVTTLEDTAYTFLAADFGFTDPNDSSANALTAVKISAIPAAGTLKLSNVAVTVGQTVSLANITAGNLKFTPAANVNGAGYASFTFQVQDDGGTANSGVDLDQSPNTMTVNVTAVNDAPAGTNKTVTTLEDTAYTFAAVDFGFTDPNDSSANALTAVKISTIPGTGTFALSGVAVTVGQTVSLANITAGNLKFTPAANANGAGYASFTFQVQDDGGTANGGVDLDQSPNTMTVNVTAVNDVPAGTNNTVTTLEDTAYTFLAADFGLTDPNDTPANALTAVKISAIPGAGTLALSGAAVTVGQTVSLANITAGNLKFTPAANANGAGYASFTFQVQDDGGTANGGVDLDQSPNTMTVNVTAVNDAPVNTVPAAQGTSENTALVFSSGNGNQILLGDVDAGSNPVQVTLTATHGVINLFGPLTGLSFSIGGGTADPTMTFTGTLTDINAALNGLTFAPDALYSGPASLTITSNDQGNTGGAVVPLSDSDTVVITVNASTAPTALNDSYSVDEDQVLNATIAGGVLLNDTSPVSNPLTVTLIGGPSHGSVLLNPDGSFGYTPIANFAGTDSFTYQATDGMDSSNVATVTITVNPVNDAPAGADNTVSTLEDAAYTFAAVDFGFADPTDTPANALSAVKITTLLGGGVLTNNGALVNAGDFVAAADIASGKLVFTPGADANGSGYASFTFQVQDDGLTANGGVDLDQSPNTMSIDVTAVNDAPAGTNNTVSALEDSAYIFASADFGFSDTADTPANALSTVKITTLLGGGVLTNNGALVNAGDFVAAGDIASGKLVFTPGADANGVGYASFTFQVQDDGLTANGGVDLDQSPNTMSIDVTAVNDVPAGTNNTVSTLEDNAYIFGSADFGFSDTADTPANALSAVKITTLLGGGVLTNNGALVNAGDFVAAGDIASGKLVFTPGADANGSGYASFTFQVQDDGLTANGGVDLDQSPNTMSIDVTAVNDAPVGTNNTVSTLEDSVYTFASADFGFSDTTDTPANALTAVKLTTLPGAGSLTDNGAVLSAGQFVSLADIAAGNLKFTPGADANGAGYASFTFQVQDDGLTANGGVDLDPSAKLMTIDVTAVNDAPAGTNNTVSTLEDNAYIFGSADFGFSDTADTPANALSAVKITTLLGGGVLTNNGALVNAGDFVAAADIAGGKLVFTPGADANGAGYASFTFQVQDDGTTTNSGLDLDPTARTMLIDVTAVNDAPAGTNNTVTTLEDNAYTFASADFGFSDAADTPSNALSAVKITTLPGAGSLTDNGVLVNAGDFVAAADIAGGMLVFTPGANAHAASYASFTFQVQDNGLTTNGGVDLDQSPNTMTIDVTVVNDAPAGTNNTITTLEETAYTFAAVDFGFSDPTSSPANSLLAVEITTLPSAGTLTDNGVAVTAGQFVTAVDIAGGKLIFTPTANANGAGYASFTFQVQDDGGIANGGVDLDPTARVLDINVTPVNDAPAGTDRTVTTLEDSDYVFSASAFGFTDAADAPSDAFFAVRITSLSSAGSLLLSGAVVSAGQMISVASINAGNLVFAPAPNANGAGYASFTFQVQDNGGTGNGGVNTDPTARTLSIDVSAVNDAPVLENNALSVRQGGSVILSDANLSAADIDTPAAGLIFTLSNVLDGQFEFVSGRGVAITSFTQANVTAGQVLFVQDGSVNSPAYDVMVSDGTLSAGPRAASVGFSRAPTGAAGGGLLVVPFVPAAPAAASSNALPTAPAPAPAPVVVTRAPPPSAPNAVVVFSGGRVLAADAVRVELPSAIRAFRGVQTTNVPKAIVNAAPTLQPSEAMMMLLIQAADPTSMQFGSGTLREWSAQSAFPADAHETERDQMKIMMESVEMGGMALSVGVVWWASRITGLISSLIASMPAWSQLDPLHIVGRDKEGEELDEGQDPDADADELAVAMVLEGPQARAGA